MNIIKLMYKKILYGYKSSSKSYIKYLRKKGVEIGNNVSFYEPNTNYVDIQKPFLIKIGNNVEITRNVIIITHDYSWAVLKQMYHEIIGARKKVVIGNNVFIGMNTIILKGVTIGDNVIIGANSVISKDVESNTVVCGSPAKKIGTIEEYYTKRKDECIYEAKEMFIEFYKRYNKIPDKKIFDEFFWLFENRNDSLCTCFKNKLELTGNFLETYENFKNTNPMFDGYDEFVKFCMDKK